MKLFKLIDISTKQTYGNISCGLIPMIGARLILETEDTDHHFRVNYPTHKGMGLSRSTL